MFWVTRLRVVICRYYATLLNGYPTPYNESLVTVMRRHDIFQC